MNDIMLDIETLGTTPGHIVTSFCAIPFSLEGSYNSSDEFYQSISIKSSLKAGLKIDPFTIMWWMRQNDDSRANFEALDHSGSDLKEVLLQFANWLIVYPKATFWGNGNRFDCGILEGAYQSLGLSAPWITKNERDMRTYIMGYEEHYESSATRKDAVHDPRKDCLYQIAVLQKVYNLKNNKK